MGSPPLPTSASPPASPAESPSRPPLTINSTSSHFADSALGISELRTPSPKPRTFERSTPITILPSPSKTTNSISGRLEQLAALAWEAEEDDRLDDHIRACIQSQLHAIEAQLEGRTRGNEQTSSDVDQSNSVTPNVSSASSVLSASISQGTLAHEPKAPLTLPPPSPDLSPILDRLAKTIASMRARLSESKHLHTLSIFKISAIAQSNANLTTLLTTARKTSTQLSHANAALRMQITDLETTTTQQSVTVSAMTGAVAGLESYIRSSSPLPNTPRMYINQSLHPPNSSARRHTVIRGTGRFRGKYPATATASPPRLPRRDSVEMDQDVTSTPQAELQEGILGWIRGFRDVEAGWREMDHNQDLHPTPTRFGQWHTRETDQPPQTPTRRTGAEEDVEVRDQGLPSRSEEEEESVLMQGDKVEGSSSDIFGREDDFGEFQSVTT